MEMESKYGVKISSKKEVDLGHQISMIELFFRK